MTLADRLRRMRTKAIIVTVPLCTGVLMRIPPFFIIIVTLLLAMRFWPPSSDPPS